MRTLGQHIGTGIAFPFRFSDRTGGVQESAEQQRIEQSMFQILSTRPGERFMRPDFGCRLKDLVFEQNHEVLHAMIRRHIIDALRRWEKRIVVDDVVTLDDASGHEVTITVQYHTVDGQIHGNMVYPLYLD